MDKKISDLNIIQSIDSADVSLLVRNQTDYQFTFATLLTYIGNNLTTGAAISFGTTLPQNNTGKNGDLFINTTSGTFAQKTSGAWTIVYTIPAGSTADGIVLYGLGVPGVNTGNDGDTYINTGTGIFYKKSSGTWSQVFSMQNGPAGVKGDKGEKGDTGANGKSILNGTVNPSNQNTGTDGDFYININTWTLFGPKANRIWNAGINLSQLESTTNLKTIFDSLADPLTINWQTDNAGGYLTLHGNYPAYQELNKGNDGKWTINGTPNVMETRNDSGQLIQLTLTPSAPGQTNFIII